MLPPVFGESVRSAQTRKVAANQAWWEYQPARVNKPSGPSLETFDPPQVTNAPITEFDAHGLGQEKNNLAAIASLQAYRETKWGANVDLFLTDQYSYRSPSATSGPEIGASVDLTTTARVLLMERAGGTARTPRVASA